MDWSDNGPVAADATTAAAAAAAPEPPPQTTVERITEILERFFLEDSRLTAELLQELSACTVDDLIKLFGCAVPALAANAAPDEPAPSEPLRKPLTEAERVRQNFEHSRWDSEGPRIWPEGNKSAFAFTKHSDRRSPRPRGATHWSC
jgi:hypothetical protein